MKRIMLIAFWIFSTVSGADSENSIASELTDLKECLAQMDVIDDRYLSRIPPEIIALDPNLKKISEGIAFIHQNAELLERQAALGKLDFFVAANSVQGCTAYRQLFQSRARLYFVLVTCALLTMFALTVNVMLNIVPVNFRRKAGTKNAVIPPQNEPQDKVVSSDSVSANRPR